MDLYIEECSDLTIPSYGWWTEISKQMDSRFLSLKVKSSDHNVTELNYSDACEFKP